MSKRSRFGDVTVGAAVVLVDGRGEDDVLAGEHLIQAAHRAYADELLENALFALGQPVELVDEDRREEQRVLPDDLLATRRRERADVGRASISSFVWSGWS